MTGPRTVLLLLALAITAPAQAQLDPRDEWAVDLTTDYPMWETANLTYRTASNVDLKLDVYAPQPLSAPNPTVLHIHGGGWVEGSRQVDTVALIPYLARGFTVVNVSYRLGRVALAPAAVEDVRCALRWVVLNADKYKFDLDRIVTTGASAGGHLALTTAFLRPSDGFDATCPTVDDKRWSSGEEPPMKVAAAVNWFGITDVADLLDGPNAKHYAIEWLGSLPSRRELARAVSPLSMVRAGLPPVLSIHGDADELVPYSHATRLHQALDKAGVPNRLVSIQKGGHGDFTREQQRANFAAIFAFLGERGLLPKGR
ncbi:MAG TPA: alpha/beta hydrolase [Vicinamibacteria bacterium]|nr:alpha/beta hydrolase [Vicinamibacteria bacterium]